MKYTAIAETGNALVRLLKNSLVPDVIVNPDHIGLCSPADKGDLAVGIHLYDVRESEEYRSHEMVMMDFSRQKYPSSYLSLYYMITVYSNGDIKYRAEEEQRILGRIVQVLKDHAILDENTLEPSEQEGGLSPTIEMLSLSMEDKMRVWNVPNAAYKMSLFYKISPVEIQSERVKESARIVDISFTVKEREEE